MPSDGTRVPVADVLARSIKGAGVRMAFGHPGGEVVVLIDALQRHGVPFLLTHHEATAAFMALGHGEYTGIPGVCVATLGPGATNLVTGVASGLLERAPLVALTGALSTAAPSGTTHQALDLNALMQPVTKSSAEVTAVTARAAIDEALRISITPRRGSAHLSLPANVAVEPVRDDGALTQTEPDQRPEPDRDALDQAREVLRHAQRPAVIVGINAVQSGAAQAVRVLARTLRAPVATLPKAKGVMPEDDPLFLGTLEMAGDDLVVDFLKDADALVVVGVDPVEFDKPWRLSAPVVFVDEVPNTERYVPASVELVGDVPRLIGSLAEGQEASTWSEPAIRERRRAIWDHIRPQGSRLHPRDVVAAVREALPRNAIATSDVGAHKMLVGQAWAAHEPRTFFMANGLSSMGYGIPVAAAIRLIDDSHPVVAFVGDGGLSMYLGELETLVRAGVDILIVVFADRSLELIRRAQLRREVPIGGVSFENPDFTALGRAFGIHVAEVATPDELARALPALIHAAGVRLLAAAIDGDDYRF
jgi:acetolactate synthase I/II/III large subunit